MSSYPDSPQKPEHFDMHVKKLQSICVMHDVRIGSRTDLPGFMQKLMDDRPFAMAFWKLIGRLSDREGGELSDDQMFAVVIEGVTGGGISPEDGKRDRSFDDLRAMLAGVDIQAPDPTRPDQTRPGPLPPSRSETSVQQRDDQSESRIAELPPRPSTQRAAFTSETAYEATEHPATLPPPPQFEEALLRPRPAGLEVGPLGPSRLVLDPPAPSAEDSLAPEQDDLPINVPLENYSQSDGYGKIVLGLLLVLVLAGAAFAAYQYRMPLQQEFAALVRRIQSKDTATPPDQNTSPDAASKDGASADQSQSSPEQPASENASTTNAPDPSASLESQPTVSPGTPVQTETAPPDGISSTDLAGAIKVDPSAMEANLIASRVPAYPEIAKANRIEGHVVMQAIISKTGAVRRVHVIEGDSRLRGAAAEAVYRWRYKPYLLNGQPVEVATTITVNFNLER